MEADEGLREGEDGGGEEEAEGREISESESDSEQLSTSMPAKMK